MAVGEEWKYPNNCKNKLCKKYQLIENIFNSDLQRDILILPLVVVHRKAKRKKLIEMRGMRTSSQDWCFNTKIRHIF